MYFMAGTRVRGGQKIISSINKFFVLQYIWSAGMEI